MRRFFNISMMIAAMAIMATSCNTEPIEDSGKIPTIKIETKSVGATTVEFSITTTNASAIYLLCSESDNDYNAEEIKANGKRVTDGDTIVDNLTPETNYTAYALAINGSKYAITEETFTTTGQNNVFEGHDLNKLVSAVYRTDNEAIAGNYEIIFGNSMTPEWVGDIRVFLDLYNAEDSDPLNPVLPNGTYQPASDYSPFTYNPSYSYVDIVVEGGEVISTPIMGIVTVERTQATYTITVEGTLLLLDNMPFAARYTGSIQFVQGGTSAYGFFEEDITLELDEAQMRYWGGWFYPFADDVGVEMFAAEFDAQNKITRGYYLHLSPLFMPKYADYNAEEVPLASGTYTPLRKDITTSYYQPYTFTQGAITDFMGERLFQGTYLQYIEGGNVKTVGLITGGDMTVEHDGANYNITMNFIADNGVKINLSYSGSLLSVNFNDNDETMIPRPWTTLTDDHTYNFPAETLGYAFCMGEMVKEGYDSWLLMIYAYNANYPDGYGDMFTAEFSVANGDNMVMPTGEFNLAMEVGDHTMYPGTTDYAGNVLFTYYGDATPDADGYSSELAPISTGKVTIEDAGAGNYRFIFDLVDDGGNKITGEWTGKVTVDDLEDDMAGTTSMPLSMRR